MNELVVNPSIQPIIPLCQNRCDHKEDKRMDATLGALVNDDLVREIALLAWLNKSETGEDMFRLITGMLICPTLCKRSETM